MMVRSCVVFVSDAHLDKPVYWKRTAESRRRARTTGITTRMRSIKKLRRHTVRSELIAPLHEHLALLPFTCVDLQKMGRGFAHHVLKTRNTLLCGWELHFELN